MLISSVKKSYDVVIVGSGFAAAAIIQQLLKRKVKNILLVTTTKGFSTRAQHNSFLSWENLAPQIDVFIGEATGINESKKYVVLRERVHHLKINAPVTPATAEVTFRAVVIFDHHSIVNEEVVDQYITHGVDAHAALQKLRTSIAMLPKKEGLAIAFVLELAEVEYWFYDLREKIVAFVEQSGHPKNNITFLPVTDHPEKHQQIDKRVKNTWTTQYVDRNTISMITSNEICTTANKKILFDLLFVIGSPKTNNAKLNGKQTACIFYCSDLTNALELYRQSSRVAHNIERLLWGLPVYSKQQKPFVFIRTNTYAGVFSFGRIYLTHVFGWATYNALLICYMFSNFGLRKTLVLLRSQTVDKSKNI